MDWLEHTPRFTEQLVRRWFRDEYGIEGTFEPLPSERDQAFKVSSDAGQCFVLKIVNSAESVSLLEAQAQMLQRLAERLDFCPRIVPTLEGAARATIHRPRAMHSAYLVTWLPGVPLARLPRPGERLYRDLGVKLGRMDAALVGFEHAALCRDLHWDLKNGPREIEQHRPLIMAPEWQRCIDDVLCLHARHVQPSLEKLRRSAIHADANDYNVLCEAGDGQRVTGIIDFGDIVHSFTVGNLAIAIAYALLENPKPLETAASITAGYHTAHRLTGAEIRACWGLVLLRLATSLCLGAAQSRARPDHDYLTISQRPIRTTLPALLRAVDYDDALAVLQNACRSAPAEIVDAAPRG